MNSDSDSEGSIDYKLHQNAIEDYNEINIRLSDRRRGIINPQTSKRTVTPIPFNTSYVNNNLPKHDEVPYKKSKKSWFLFIFCCKRGNH